MKTILFSLALAYGGIASVAAAPAARPDPATNPASPLMLAVPGLPADSHAIDFDHLPRLPVEHAVVSDVSARGGVNQHNYLAYYAGRFWVMWSDGPRREDMGGQVVKYATSLDGLKWDGPQAMTGYPPHTPPGSKHYNTRDPEGMRYIARGFWIRDGQLLALVSLDESAGFFGPSLELEAFRWDAGDGHWTYDGVVGKDVINNFPPERLPNGRWGMICRPHDYVKTGVKFLVGGLKVLDAWKAYPVVSGAGGSVALKAEEPIWYSLPAGNLVALFRDNARSGFLYRAFSTDNGTTWTPPVKTNFPDARSKLSALRMHDGRYVLVSNSNPAKRDPLTLAVSPDGLVFDRLFYVVGGRDVDYPHVMEHDGYLYIAHSGAKQTVEIERVSIADLDRIPMPAK